jgi:HK97 family phage major capsid protein
MPRTITTEPTSERLDYLRGLAEIHGRMQGLEAKERTVRFHMAADEELIQLWKKRAVENYKRTGDANPVHPMERKGLDMSHDQGGGYLDPSGADIAAILAKGLSDYNPIRDYAGKGTLLKGDLYPNPVITGRPGVRRLRETDSHATPTTDMILAGEQIPVHTYNSTVPVSNKLFDSSAFSPNDFVIEPVMQAFLVAESHDFVVGSGVGCPEGIFINGSVTQIKSGSNSTVLGDNLRAMFYALAGCFRNNGYWMLNDATELVVKQLKDASGTYIFNEGFYGLVPPTMFGRPVLSCPDAPAIAGGAFPIAFGDMTRYRIIDRTPLAVLVDPFSNKPNYVYDCVRRVGGQVIDPTAFVKMVIST